MPNVLALDLKVLRRKSGLTQEDCAHLLEVHPSKVSLMESGKALPTLREIAALTVIYGRNFEGLFQAIVIEVHQTLRDRLSSMPEAPKRWLGTLNRQTTLNAMADRLTVFTNEDYAAA
jgi:transcriptional regulator with XRE-family HTH domain